MTTTNSQYRQLHGLLVHAQTKRAERPGYTNNEPDWLIFERQNMLDGVNVLRQEIGLPNVEMPAIVRADTMASGHVDYTSKFALYCSEIAQGRIPKC